MSVEKPAGLDLAAVLRAARRRKYVVIVTTVIAVTAAVAVALTARPVYRAEVVIAEVEEGQGSEGLASRIGDLAGLAGINVGATSDASRSARALLQSRHLSEEFVKRNDLMPELFRDSSERPTLWLAVKRFRDGIMRISENTRRGTTTLSIDWTDAATAARWANGLVALANDLIRARALDEATRNLAYLHAQLEKTTDVEMQRAMYDLVRDETQTLMLANERPEYAFAVVDPAVAPETRIRPRRTVIVLIGLVIGVSLGAVAAVGIDRRRGRA